MGNMGAMAGLWRQIQNEMRDAVSEAESKTFSTANQELTASYAGGEPIPPEQGGYVRTYQMKTLQEQLALLVAEILLVPLCILIRDTIIILELILLLTSFQKRNLGDLVLC